MAPKRKVKAELPRDDERSDSVDLDSETLFAQLAQKHWLKSKKSVKVKSDVLKNEIWDVLERDEFAFKSLLALENLQILERYNRSTQSNNSVANRVDSYLWPGYSEDSSNFHILLIVLITNVKTREHLPTWSKQGVLDSIRGPR
jgi:intron-binding protein aquarius